MAKAYYIPNGPKNLQDLFPDIDFNDLSEYYFSVKTQDNAVIATGSLNQLGGCCDENKIRVHFLNYAGATDAVNFILTGIDHEPKSDTWQKQLATPLRQSEHAINRFNVKSNNTYHGVNTEYGENEMAWLNELFDSPLAWLEINGTQDQPDGFLPIVITDKKIENVKQDDRFTYQTEIEFTLSHEKIIIRN
ncbi:MAG TPA: hypothetical protein VK644_10500 [Chitinophagaceae bacterium]|nr:hypothetical protein [Chitinophagaceae bacterium]